MPDCVQTGAIAAVTRVTSRDDERNPDGLDRHHSSAPHAGPRVQVQKFGTFLSNMVMPNIGAFIAWGLITAFFIEAAGSPGRRRASPDTGPKIGGATGRRRLVGPMITYLLPILIAYTGGQIVYGTRGGVVGAVSVMGVILAIGDPICIGDGRSPMFLGAMIMGPLGGWSMKRLDALWDGKIRPGFEMLVNNFSAGICRGMPGDRRHVPAGPVAADGHRLRWATASTGWSTTTCCRSPRSSSSRRRSCSSTTRSTTAC